MENLAQNSSTMPVDANAEPEELPLMVEYWLFLKESKKWWMTPILVVALLIGSLIAIGATPLGPFIYSLF